MRQRSVAGISFIVALVALTGTARAQSVANPGTWTVTPFVGTSIDVSQPQTGNSLGLGVGVEYDLTSNLGFEGELSHLFDVVGGNADVDWSVTNVSGNAIYHFDVRHVTPYATFGIGVEHSGVDMKSTDPVVASQFPGSSTEVSFNFGGGVKYQVKPSLLVRGDLRRFEANDQAPDHWRLYGGVSFALGH